MKSEKISDALNFIDDALIKEAMVSSQNNKRKRWIRWGATAACITLVAISALSIPKLASNSPAKSIKQLSVSSDSPSGVRKFMNYNGHRYSFIENGATFDLNPTQLIDILGTLEYDIQKDTKNNGKDFASTFAIGGTVYQVSSYAPSFRVAVELNGDYYLCENVDSLDGSNINISDYFDAADFVQNVKEVVIYDHAGKHAFETLSGKDAIRLIQSLQMVTPANLAPEDYEKIGKAQKEGESYTLSFQLKDSTKFKMYVIPSLSIAMIGDNRYTLTEEFTSEYIMLFEGFTKQSVPMY